MYTINMLSRADKVAGQGVGSAYLEHIGLMRRELPDFHLKINSWGFSDLIHVHTINPEFRLNIQGTRHPLIGSVHFLPETLDGSINLPGYTRKIFDWYVLNFYQHMHELVTVNPLFIEKLVELGFRRDRLHYIPNYVNAEVFKPLDELERISARQKWNLSQQEFVVVGAGQVQTRKGIKDFVEVARLLPDVTFLWAGGFSFGRITDGYQELNDLVTSAPSNCRFLGIVSREDMPSLYGIADLMFLPSYAELFPMTILEAVNADLPILLRELDLYDAVLGSSYLAADAPNTFAAQITKLINSPKRYVDAKEISRALKAQYSAEYVGNQWRKLYTKLIETPRELRQRGGYGSGIYKARRKRSSW